MLCLEVMGEGGNEVPPNFEAASPSLRSSFKIWGNLNSPLPPSPPSEALDQEALDLIIQQTLEENTLLQTNTDFDIIDWLTLDAVGTPPPDAGLFIPPPEEQMRSA